jgi:hypothetical protein
MVDDEQLDELRVSLLRGGRPNLGPEEGDEAFDRHILLAARIHQAARLNQAASDNETQAWVRYFDDHFTPTHAVKAKLLWTDWRCRLLKDTTPGGNVVLAHGSARVHWTRDARGRLLIDLESMWDDFEQSVDNFIATLAADQRRRKVVLARFRDRVWTVEHFEPVGYAGFSSALADAGLANTGGATAVSASAIESVIGRKTGHSAIEGAIGHRGEFESGAAS